MKWNENFKFAKCCNMNIFCVIVITIRVVVKIRYFNLILLYIFFVNLILIFYELLKSRIRSLIYLFYRYYKFLNYLLLLLQISIHKPIGKKKERKKKQIRFELTYDLIRYLSTTTKIINYRFRSILKIERKREKQKET